MKLWVLRPVNEETAPWMPWFDRMFGFVIRAKSESAARKLAAEQAGDEGPEAWLSPESASCTELQTDGEATVIMQDYNPAALGKGASHHHTGQRTDQAHKLAARH